MMRKNGRARAAEAEDIFYFFSPCSLDKMDIPEVVYHQLKTVFCVSQQGGDRVKELRMGISSLKMPGTKVELRKGPSEHKQQLGVRGDPFKGQSLHLEEEGCYTFPP